MRIISGKFKGKRLIAPKKIPTRPTTDMAKEGLFNILNNHYYFDECSVLDLFAGTGNISYEFASRGTTQITAVEANARCVKFIEKTSQELDFSIDAIKSDVFKYLLRVKIKADIIFADPPYAIIQEEFEQLVKLVFENELLHENGLLIIEHSTHTKLSELEQFSNSRKYGGSVFSFFENKREE
ncbi:16S rRNA (guanine(966)-N(2))-methyltransferase RsmD [Aurantibacter sp.]|uniref:16S rRNA (guanine(966)-N(2))-methyltransferase RsmD n=1 Tax=Aurantibacter sp. TaxID=2807103 RepID=UPI003264393E